VRARSQSGDHASYTVGQIVLRVRRMVNAVLAATGCATLEADNLRDKSRVYA
jgi:hypothetical protein